MGVNGRGDGDLSFTSDYWNGGAVVLGHLQMVDDGTESTSRDIAASTASFGRSRMAFIAGPLCGLLAVPFIRLLGWAKTEKANGWQTFMFPVLSLTLLGGLGIKFPEMLGNGKDVVQLSFLHQSTTTVLLVLLLICPLATAIILRSGVPGGLFTATMCFGAVVGLLLGRAWDAVLPPVSPPVSFPASPSSGPVPFLRQRLRDSLLHSVCFGTHPHRRLNHGSVAHRRRLDKLSHQALRESFYLLYRGGSELRKDTVPGNRPLVSNPAGGSGCIGDKSDVLANGGCC